MANYEFPGDRTDKRVREAELNNLILQNHNFVITGCEVTAVGGNLITEISSGTIFMDGVGEIAISSDQVSLSTGDATHDRCDLIVVDNTGTISVIEGTPATPPATPSYNEYDYVVLAFVVVPDNATAIDNNDIQNIGIENVRDTVSNNEMFLSSYKLLLKNHIRELLQNSGVYSKDGEDLFGEAYTSDTGRNSSVNIANTTAVFDTNAYKPDGSSDSVIRHDIPNNIIKSGTTKAFGTALIKEWVDGSDVQFKLQRSGDEEGWELSSAIRQQNTLSTQDTIPQGLFFKDDGTKLYEVGSNSDLVYQYSLTTPWEINTASYDSVSYSTQGSQPQGLFFKDDGTKLYEITVNSTIYQHTLSTAWDLSTASYDSVSYSLQGTKDTGLFFKDDGTKLYELDADGGGSNVKVFQHTLSTPWDLSTASYDSVSYSLQGDDSEGMFIGNNGTKLYEASDDSDKIYQHTLSTAWDLSTASYDGVSISTTTNSFGVFFKYDGTVMYEVGTANNKIYQYELSTPWDISTATHSEKKISTQGGEPRGLFFKDDGTKLYEVDRSANAMYQYTLSTPWEIDTASYDSVSYSTQDSESQGIFIGNNGTKLYEVNATPNVVYQHTLSTAWDLSTASYDGVSTPVQETDIEGIFFKPDGTKYYTIGTGSDKIYQHTLSTAWDLSTASYDGVSISTQDGDPQGLFFKDDGTKLYETGATNNKIYQYDLSTPWDLSTASYNNTNINVSGENTDLFIGKNGTRLYNINNSTNEIIQYNLINIPDIDNTNLNDNTFDTSGEISTGVGIFIGDNGRKLYVGDSNTHFVYEYDLTTPYQVSTAVYNSKSFDASPQVVDLRGIYFRFDGMKLYINDNNADKVYQYSLSTAWDVSTASYDSVSYSTQSSAENIFIGNNGSKLYEINRANSTIYQHTLSTAWDLSTASYDSVTLDISSEGNAQRGIAFDTSGTILFTCDDGNGKVFQYSLTTPWDISTASYDNKNFDAQTVDPSSLYINIENNKLYVLNTDEIIYEYDIGDNGVTEETSWLNTNVIAEYDTLSNAPNRLLVKILPNSSGFPTLRGFAFRAE